ncbi:MAG: carbohydrate kinase [Roseburia sp.]|nr:carbohydrate kinase [Roseburia sp.]
MAEKRYDVVALGELLIDFTENGVSAQGNPLLEANPGGAPCNVLAMLQSLGHRTAFIGKVGDDIFGRRLSAALDEVGIDQSGLVTDAAAHTTLAFVEKRADGDRDFSFYRDPGADMLLRAEEVQEKLLKDTVIFHFGTLSMTHEPARTATKKAIAVAKENGALLSFDPNLREPLWESLDAAREQVHFGMQQCDVLKISDNELVWFTGEEDYNAGICLLQKEYGIPLILLSMGCDGSRAYYGKRMVEAAPFLQETTIETTGAGDTFMGSCLHFLLKWGLEELSDGQLREMLVYANAAASIITTRKGALRVMPKADEIEALAGKTKE